jgi:hypothetical protein
MKKFFVLAVIACFLLVSCKSKAEKDAEEIQKQNYKNAETEISTIAVVLADYLSKNSGNKLPAQKKPSDWTLGKESSLYQEFMPYLKVLPYLDSWGRPYEIYLGKLCNGKFGISNAAYDDYLIVSYGINGVQEKFQYDPNKIEAGLYSDFDETKNLINFNGFMIRGKKK